MPNCAAFHLEMNPYKRGFEADDRRLSQRQRSHDSNYYDRETW